jgi:hypothetical protein
MLPPELFKARPPAAPSGVESGEPRDGELRLRRAVLRYTAIYWLVFYAMATLRSMANGSSYLLLQAGQRLVMMTFGFALCVAMLRLLRRHAAEPWARQGAVGLAAAAGASLIYFPTNYLIFYVAAGLEPAHGAAAKISSYLIEFFWVFPGWVLLYAVTVARQPAPSGAGEPQQADAIWVSHRGVQKKVAVELITWVESERDYVRIRTREGSHMLRSTMGQMETQLGPDRFIRLHRRIIAARALIDAIVRHPDGRVTARLVSGEELPVGRTYAQQVREALLRAGGKV